MTDSEPRHLAPTNLATPSTPMIGRDHELIDVLDLCESARVVTITGPGGAGKTRLAEAVAARRRAVSPDGVWWVDLAEVSASELVATTALTMLGLSGHDPDPLGPLELLDPDCTIVLDNAEHVLDACAAFVSAVCRRTTRVTVLTTSREALGLRVEQTWRIPVLALPPESAEPADVPSYAAVELFVARARQVCSDFGLTEEDAPEIASICRRLDGLPLAIELAAARTRMMSPARILSGLDDRFQLLTGGGRRSVARHQTLRSSMEWSHDLIDPAERVVFRRLAVFVGGFTLDAAEAVVVDESIGPSAVLDLLTGLVDKSLVVAEPDDRFRLLESVREFAREQLIAAGETASIRHAHLAWVMGRFADAEPHLVGAEQEQWLARLDAEHPNLRAAVDWAAALDDGAALWSLAGSLGHYLVLGSHFAEAANLFDRAEGLAPAADTATQLPGRWARAYTSLYEGAFERAYGATRDLIDRAEAAGEELWLARGLDVLGTMSLYLSLDEASTHLARAAQLAEASGDRWCRCDALQVLAYAHLMQDDHLPARAALEASAPVDRRLGNPQLHAWQVIGEAWVELRTGQVPLARALCGQALDAADRARDITTRGIATCLLGRAAVTCGDLADASAILSDELERCVDRQAGLAVPALASALGLCRAAAGEPDRALAIMDRADVDAMRSGLDRTLVHAKTRAIIEVAAGDRSAAEHTLESALDAATEAGSSVIVADLGLLVAHLGLRDGHTDEPHRRALGAIESVREQPVWEIVVDALYVLAQVAHLEGRQDDAARLRGAAQGLLDRSGARCTAAMAVLDQGCIALDADVTGWDGDAFAEGRMLETEAVCEWVLRARGRRGRPPTGWDSLTPTEWQVADLVARGLTNREIGARLFITAGTVKTHLSHVYAKLGMRNRTDVAAAIGDRSSNGPRRRP